MFQLHDQALLILLIISLAAIILDVLAGAAFAIKVKRFHLYQLADFAKSDLLKYGAIGIATLSLIFAGLPLEAALLTQKALLVTLLAATLHSVAQNLAELTGIQVTVFEQAEESAVEDITKISLPPLPAA